MNTLSNTYIFYADIYFVQNLIIKIAVLYLSLYCNKRHEILSSMKGMGKIVLAACLGTFAEILGLLYGSSYRIFLLFIHIFELPLLMRIVLGRRSGQIVRLIISGYFFVMLINAVLEFLCNYLGTAGNYIVLLSASSMGVFIGVRMYQNYKRIQKGIYPVELNYGGKRILTHGFYDSGNHLKDPYTGKGVHIISDKLLSQLSVKTQKEVYIPYQSLGKEQGIIRAYYLDYIRIQKEQDVAEEWEVPVGAANENLFEGKQYQIILNERI